MMCAPQGEDADAGKLGEAQGVRIPDSARSGAVTPDVGGSLHSTGAAALGALPVESAHAHP